MRGRLQRVKMGVTRTSCLPRSGDSPDAIPVFATAAHAAILALMPTLEINATQPWLIAQPGNVVEIIGKFCCADPLRNAVNQLQSLLYAA